MNNIKLINEIISESINKIKINSIKGEVISIKLSGKHTYITLKDGEYNLQCIGWSKIFQDIKDGDKVEITGIISILKTNFSIYFKIDNLKKIGTGDYLLEIYNYKNKIIELNWHLNKKKLTVFPYTIGIITAIEGAAIQDILQTFKLDNFIGNIIIKNTIVQGKSSPASIINNIKYFNNIHLDLLLITRGGGALEDLISFSDWNVIEEIHNSNHITISAVGHQTDNQLSDDVADYKFATPSISAKYIVEEQKRYINIYEKLKQKTDELLEKLSDTYDNFKNMDYNNMINKIEMDNNNRIYRDTNIKLREIISRYNNIKDKFNRRKEEIRVRIYDKDDEEIIKMDDMIENRKNSKMKIVLEDGDIDIQYKIIKYEYKN